MRPTSGNRRPSLVARLVIGVAAACALASPVFAQDGGLVIYSSQHAALTREWAQAFTAETGIQITIRQGTDVSMGNQLVQEGANSRPISSSPRTRRR